MHVRARCPVHAGPAGGAVACTRARTPQPAEAEHACPPQKASCNRAPNRRCSRQRRGKTTYKASLKGRRVVGARQMCPALLSAGDVRLPSAVRENDVQGVLERAPRRWSAPSVSREVPRGPGGDQPRHARAAFCSGYGARGADQRSPLRRLQNTCLSPHTVFDIRRVPDRSAVFRCQSFHVTRNCRLGRLVHSEGRGSDESVLSSASLSLAAGSAALNRSASW